MAMNEIRWTCEQVEARLGDYVDRLLAASARSGFEAHVAGCARCAPLVRRVAGLVADLRRLEPLEPSPQLTYAILDRTLGPRKVKQGWRAWFAWLRPVWQPRFAYGALTIAITLGVIFQAMGIQWRRPTVTDFNPVNIYRAADRRAHLLYARGAKFVSDLRVVYEIQSRLRPEAEPEAPPEPKPGNAQPPGQSNGPQPKNLRQLNRAHELNPRLSVLACALNALPARSLR